MFCCRLLPKVKLLLFSPVSLQDSVNEFNRVVGDSVTLPCMYVNQKPSTDVLWRLNASIKVLNIIDGKPSTEKQDGLFKSRTESFPSEYAKGNYSIKLKDLNLTHAGIYTCFLQNSNEEKKMQLFVKGTWNPCLINYDFKLHTTVIAVLNIYTALIHLQNCFSLPSVPDTS